MTKQLFTIRLFIVFVSIFCLTVYAESEVLPKPVVIWQLDAADSGKVLNSQIADSLGHPFGIDIAGNPVWTSTGVPTTGTADGKAIIFSGKDAIGIRDADVVGENGKMSFNGALTLLVRIKADRSDTYSGGTSKIITRLKSSGGNKGFSWMLLNKRWGIYSFVIWNKGTAYSVDVHAGQWNGKHGDGTWLNLFAVFTPGKSIALYAYGSDGSRQSHKIVPVFFNTFDVSNNQRHTTLGGQYDSNFNVPTGSFRGEIESVAIWNQALSERERERIMGTKAIDQSVFELNSGELVTPHVPWANPLVGGAVKS